MIQLNVGCWTRNFGDEWIHIDQCDQDHIDIKDDIRNLNKHFENGTVDLIYASHVIEYFDRQEVALLLESWVPLLKPGGILRVAVPDFANMVTLYRDRGYPLERFLGPLYGRMDKDSSGDKIYHKTVYDEYHLMTLLSDAGLNNVKKWDWRKVDHGKFNDFSQAHLPHKDTENGISVSLNMQGTRS